MGNHPTDEPRHNHSASPAVPLILWVALCLTSCGNGVAPDAEVSVGDSSAESYEFLEYTLRGEAQMGVALGAPSDEVVLLLHGGRFSSATWMELGTLDVLAESGQRVVAIDLPGFGKSGSVKGSDRGQQLLEIMDALHIKRAVVIAPSMSGCFLLPFASEHPERLIGVVPVAPACMESFSGAPGVPALVLWGELDSTFPLAQAAPLAAKFDGGQVEVFPGGSHPCYLDDPERFHRLLTAFLPHSTHDGG